jgi:hypothetical protein
MGVPGDDAWDPGWAQLLAGRRVSVIMDCDRAGRKAVARTVPVTLNAGGGCVIAAAQIPARLHQFEAPANLQICRQLYRTRIIERGCGDRAPAGGR